jgi:hypothetical protein
MSKKYFFILIFFAELNPIIAQKTIEKQSIVWGQLFLNLDFKDPKWYLVTDIQNRGFIAPVKAQNTFNIRARMYRRVSNNWEWGIGFAYFITKTNNPKVILGSNQPEIRPFLELVNRQALGKGFNLSHRYILERRFTRKMENGALISGYIPTNRFRYRLNGEYDFFKIKEKSVKLRINDELFVQFGKNVKRNWFDQNRIGVSLIWPLSKLIGLETGYANWMQELASGDDFYNRNVWRMGIIVKMKVKK